ncbi:MAG TPA: alpha-galactosidase [Armatimonadota bacterium]|jgi:alpha-galactosidase
MANAEAPTAAERADASLFVQSTLGSPGGPAPAPPVSFLYGGKPFRDVAAGWAFSHEVDRHSDHRVRHTLTWRDPETKLTVRCEAVEYTDAPTVEWTVWLSNEGAADTPIIEDLLALDTAFQRGKEGEFLLHHNVGSLTTRDDFSPLETALPAGAEGHYGGEGGRPTSRDMSYFNLDWGGKGVILAFGWPGQWTANFRRDASTGCRVTAGQEKVHLRLHPGEKVRTPLIAVQTWQGDWIHAQNVWRQWMRAENLPTIHGAAPKPILLAASSRMYAEMINANEDNQKMMIDRYAEEGIALDYWWMDAGWYPNANGWPDTGTWEVDRKRFPNGLRAVSDHARAKHVKTLLWFEPERVAPGTWLAENRPQWLLEAPGVGANGNRLLNLGNPEARQWLTDHVDALLAAEGIGLYRQDFNMEPLAYWRAADVEDRQGIAENRHVVGLLAYWDELRKRHPDMLIDTCASGGRRVDLECLRRAAPLWRSDYAYEPVGHQGQTYGLSAWVPFSGTGTAGKDAGYYGEGNGPVDSYTFWSNVAPSTVLNFDLRPRDKDFGDLRERVALWRSVADDYSGDFIPLMPFSKAEDQWIAWQFNRPEAGRGFVQAFRRPASAYGMAELRLRGLEPGARYEVRSVDPAAAPTEVRGADLMEKGLAVAIGERPGCAVIVYRKVKG